MVVLSFVRCICYKLVLDIESYWFYIFYDVIGFDLFNFIVCV